MQIILRFLSIITFELEINQSLEILNNCFKLYKPSINVDKTKLMIYRKKRQVLPINVNLNNLLILKMDTFILLGITFNKFLNWSDHIFVVSNKISKCIYIIKYFQYAFSEYI